MNINIWQFCRHNLAEINCIYLIIQGSSYLKIKKINRLINIIGVIYIIDRDSEEKWE
jgi:hypothetical protein